MAEEWILLAPASGLASIAIALALRQYVRKQDAGTEKMGEIAAAITEGAKAFLARQYKTLAIFGAVMSILLFTFLPEPFFKGGLLAVAYIIGAVCSGLAGYLGMDIAVRANVRTAQAARESLNKAFPIAFFAGGVMGLLTVGLALLGISIIYYIVGDPEIVLGFSLGASSIALFAKAGGGIYTKTADISADLVGKVEVGIPEDDPRNPAVIADNVGDNVGDVAGMGADLFDSYVASIVAAMILGVAAQHLYGGIAAILPMLFAAAGIISSIIGMLFVRVGERGNPGASLNRGTYATTIIFAVITLLITYMYNVDIGIWYATIAGLISGVIIGLISDYYTSIDRSPAQRTAEAAQTGAAIDVITGLSYGFLSILMPLIGIAIASIVAYQFAGLYGVGIAAVGMLSITGMIVSADAYGPISDNAKGIAEQSGLGEEVIATADRLDAAGNTAKAITKGFAIGAAGLTVIALLAAYAEIVDVKTFNLMEPHVLAGALIGIAMPPVFSAMVMLGVSRNAFRMIGEIRRQFKEIPGIMEGKNKPDYAKCVDIAAKGAIKELMPPSILTIVVTLAVGFVLGKQALGGYLAGAIFTGLVFALFMANGGGLLDNAKKFIEEGHYGGKGSESHKNAVVGDTVGDPLKDTAGPSLNTMITVMSLVASIFAPLFALFSLLG
jgi:K(+)-stimulated pyrophosphate-energized sodium pump